MMYSVGEVVGYWKCHRYDADIRENIERLAMIYRQDIDPEHVRI